MIVGCYSLDLYCDLKNDQHEFKEFPRQFTAEYGSECRVMARSKGWKLNIVKQTAICPKCVDRLRRQGLKQKTIEALLFKAERDQFHWNENII